MSRTPDDCEKRISPDFRKRLLDLIFDQECTKAEFAQLVGVNKEVITRATVYSIVPSVKSLIKIADSLNISLEYLLAKTDKISYHQLDNQCHFGKSYTSRWIRKKSIPSLYILEILTDHFNVSLDYLLGRID